MRNLPFDTASMLLLLALGVLLTLRSGFFQLRGLPFIHKNTTRTLLRKDASGGKSISSFQAVTTALAGTMGVGNIAGVATALVAGGPGAIFWMWVSAFFGMMTKYAEIYLAVLFRKKNPEGLYYGGPMYYMSDKKNGLGNKWLAAVFAAVCVLSSFGIGNMTQVNSVSTAAKSAFSIPELVSGPVVALCLALVVFGGVKRIARATEMIIPFISIIYLFSACVLLWINRAYLGGSLRLIVENAFGIGNAAGGVLGYSVSQAVRLGLSRGVFTNEAGLGSAPIAHAAADCKSPAHQGAWGIFEVFLDTIVVCTITALAILTACGGTLWQSGLDGAALTTAAFESVFGASGRHFVAVSIALFAIPSMLGWCYYGESALSYLIGGRKRLINGYRILFIAFAVIGAVAELRIVWAAADVLNAMMALPNLIAIFLLRRKVTVPKA